MNLLFLTLVEINSIESRGIYEDLLRKFRNEGHDVTIVTAVERRRKTPTNLIQKEGVSILQVKTFNIQKTNVLEKGIGTLALEFQYLQAIKNFFNDKKFDLILYATPPITLVKVVEYLKKRNNAYAYLLLKDIFPQNAVDMKMLKNGSFLHKQFVRKEKKLYEISDTIGCMSPANVSFLLNNHPDLNKSKFEINPNTIEPKSFEYTDIQREQIRIKYEIPTNKKVLVYGGNLGKPQGLSFLLETIQGTAVDNIYFLIVGDGTEYLKTKDWFSRLKPANAKLLQRLPKEDYDQLLSACDIGLIFLDRNFTIPNFPSRLLSYLEMKKPVLAATDTNTDIGKVIELAGCGYWVKAGDINGIQKSIKKLCSDDLAAMGQKGWELLKKDFLVDRSYLLIKEKCHA